MRRWTQSMSRQMYPCKGNLSTHRAWSHLGILEAPASGSRLCTVPAAWHRHRRSSSDGVTSWAAAAPHNRQRQRHDDFFSSASHTAVVSELSQAFVFPSKRARILHADHATVTPSRTPLVDGQVCSWGAHMGSSAWGGAATVSEEALVPQTHLPGPRSPGHSWLARALASDGVARGDAVDGSGAARCCPGGRRSAPLPSAICRRFPCLRGRSADDRLRRALAREG